MLVSFRSLSPPRFFFLSIFEWFYNDFVSDNCLPYQIRGTNYNGSIDLFKGKAPTLFGGDLQAFTQMQRSKFAGYVGNFGVMSANLTAALQHVDKKLGQVEKLFFFFFSLSEKNWAVFCCCC